MNPSAIWLSELPWFLGQHHSRFSRQAYEEGDNRKSLKKEVLRYNSLETHRNFIKSSTLPSPTPTPAAAVRAIAIVV